MLSVPDGRSVTALLNATPIHSEDGTVESVVVTMQDLGPVQELERLRAEFLGMVSHELRAPLTSIKGASATVLAAARVLDPAEVRQFFRIIDEQANHMDSLISDLLDAGRIEAGTLSVVPEPSEVAALVDVARNTFLSGGSRHTVLIDLPADLPRVMADRQRIAQVLNNLFSNAVRHAPVTSPIQVSALRDGFKSRSRSATRAGGGSGATATPVSENTAPAAAAIGRAGAVWAWPSARAWSKPTADAFGPTAQAPAKARVSRSRSRLPTIQVARAGSARSDLRAAGEVHEPTRILVVDDDPQTLRYVRDVLTAADYDALVTGDGRDLARIIETEKPDLVLLDLMLPGTDGIELMESVPELAGLPVIFISGYGRGRDHRTGARQRRCRLHCKTVLVDRTHSPHPGSAAPPAGARILCARRLGHPLRSAPGDRRGRSSEPDGDRVPTAIRPVGQRRAGVDLRHSAAPGPGRSEATPPRLWCARTSRDFAASSATTRVSRPTSLTSAGSATAWLG